MNHEDFPLTLKHFISDFINKLNILKNYHVVSILQHTLTFAIEQRQQASSRIAMAPPNAL